MNYLIIKYQSITIFQEVNLENEWALPAVHSRHLILVMLILNLGVSWSN